MRLAQWIAGLPPYTAVLACNDIRGQQVVNAARIAGVEIPDRLIVLGIDDDEVICDLCAPSLSSITQDLRRIGMLAAAKLEEALASGERTGGRFRVPPLRVVERGSTDALGGDDPLIIRAGRILRARATKGASVKEICAELDCTRTALDTAFLRTLGRTIASELTRIRLDSLKYALASTVDPLDKIAADHGFSTGSYLCRFFRRESGMTPQGYRDALDAHI